MRWSTSTETLTSDRTTWPSSSSTSPTRRPAARSRRRRGTWLAGTAILGAALLLPAAPRPAAAAAAPCAPLAVRPLLAAPQSGDLFLRGGAATCTTIAIEVAAHGVEGVFTAAFDLSYPATLLRFEGYVEGPLLAKGSPRTKPFYLVRNPAPGSIQITLTRFAPDGAVAAAAGETVVTLLFSRLAPGTADLDFNQERSSPIAESILDAAGAPVTARFGPGHGAALTVP